MTTLGERIGERLKATGQSARAASLRAGLGADAIRNVLSGRSGSPKMSTLRALAQALDTTIPYLTGERSDPSRGSSAQTPYVELPVLHTVAAGPWLAAEDALDSEPEVMSVPAVPGFEGCKQWIERVRGDSFNQFIADGSYVHVVDAIDLGYVPREGDVVIVTRSRAQGALVERTIKQVALGIEGVLLHPRSHNPKWQKSLVITDGISENEDDVEVRIAALVLRAFLDFNPNVRWHSSVRGPDDR